jgi:hypothetical protein
MVCGDGSRARPSVGMKKREFHMQIYGFIAGKSNYVPVHAKALTYRSHKSPQDRTKAISHNIPRACDPVLYGQLVHLIGDSIQRT